MKAAALSGAAGDQTQLGDGLGGLGHFAAGLGNQDGCLIHTDHFQLGFLRVFMSSSCKCVAPDRVQSPSRGRLAASGAEVSREFGQASLPACRRIGEPCGHSIGAEVQPGLGGANETPVQVAHHGHVIDEDAVEPVHLGLQSPDASLSSGWWGEKSFLWSPAVMAV
jgi:hypothetical protein